MFAAGDPGKAETTAEKRVPTGAYVFLILFVLLAGCNILIAAGEKPAPVPAAAPSPRPSSQSGQGQGGSEVVGGKGVTSLHGNVGGSGPAGEPVGHRPGPQPTEAKADEAEPKPESKPKPNLKDKPKDQDKPRAKAKDRPKDRLKPRYESRPKPKGKRKSKHEPVRRPKRRPIFSAHPGGFCGNPGAVGIASNGRTYVCRGGHWRRP